MLFSADTESPPAPQFKLLVPTLVYVHWIALHHNTEVVAKEGRTTDDGGGPLRRRSSHSTRHSSRCFRERFHLEPAHGAIPEYRATAFDSGREQLLSFGPDIGAESVVGYAGRAGGTARAIQRPCAADIVAVQVSRAHHIHR